MVSELGKLLILLGIAISIVGLVMTFLPTARLGRLPGDIIISFKNGRIFIPLTTCVLLSLILSLVLWLVSHFRR